MSVAPIMDETSPLINGSADDKGLSFAYEEVPRPSGNNLGLVNGVVVPCLLNIVGAVLFLRLSWAVGQAGFFGVLIMFLIGELQTTLTALSLSALISNGEMRGGGAYYIISRAVGPELGGAIGVCFYFSYSVGCCFYMVSTAESMVEALVPNSGWSYYSIHVLFASGCLWVGIAISVLGAHCFTKVNVPLFVIQFGSILWGTMSIWFSPDPCAAGPIDNITGLACGTLLCNNGTAAFPCGSYHGWSLANFANNSWFGFTSVNCNGQECNWLVVYSVVFTAVTGIFEGANLSGDLRDPNRHIWRGTLIAIWGAFFTYFIAMVGFAGGFDRATLQADLYVLQELAFGSKWIIIVGIWVACFTSGLGGLMGGSRILQAISRDKIFPGIQWAGRGFGKGDEPRLAVLLTGAIAQVAILIGNLDTIAPIITTFFCMSYALVNMSLLLVAIAGTPNFRPRFKYFHWTTALLGFLSNFVVMWALSWIYALAACAIFSTLVLILSFVNANRTIDWGDIRMALVYHQVRKFLLRMDPRVQHGKLWRPSVLLLTRLQRSNLLEVCNYLKRGGIYVVGDVVLSTNLSDSGLQAALHRRQVDWMDTVADSKIKAFSQVLVAPTARLGYHNLVTCAGLGAMQPNTVVIPMWRGGGEDEETCCADIYEYVSLIGDAAAMGKNVVVACNFSEVPSVHDLLEPKQTRWIDMFLLPHEPSLTWEEFTHGPLGTLTLGWGLIRKKLGMRVLYMAPEASHEVLESQRDTLIDIVKRKARFRIGKKGDQIFVLPFNGPIPPLDSTDYFVAANQFIQLNRRENTSLSLLPMPRLQQDAQVWLQQVSALIHNAGPVFLVYKAPEQIVMSRKL